MKARLSGMSPGGLLSTGTGFAALAGFAAFVCAGEAFDVLLPGDAVAPSAVGVWVAGALEAPGEAAFVPPQADRPAEVDASRTAASRAERRVGVLFMRRACATADETTMRVRWLPGVGPGPLTRRRTSRPSWLPPCRSPVSVRQALAPASRLRLAQGRSQGRPHLGPDP